MSSLSPTHALEHSFGGKRTLQRLRRMAGYRSAKDFAKALGIPCSTYAVTSAQGMEPTAAFLWPLLGKSQTSSAAPSIL